MLSDRRCRFLVIDLDDTVLPMLAEFDWDNDPARVVPFDAEVPNGVPISDTLAEEVRSWAGGVNVGRVVFYSAREETDAPGAKSPAPKKATAPKKVTNAALVEQILNWQLKFKQSVRCNRMPWQPIPCLPQLPQSRLLEVVSFPRCPR